LLLLTVHPSLVVVGSGGHYYYSYCSLTAYMVNDVSFLQWIYHVRLFESVWRIGEFSLPAGKRDRHDFLQFNLNSPNNTHYMSNMPVATHSPDRNQPLDDDKVTGVS
jgi:hypothetical protein